MRRRLKRLRVLLTTEKVFREGGTSALDYGAKGDSELVPWPSVPPRAPLEQALAHRMRYEGGHEVSDNLTFLYAGWMWAPAGHLRPLGSSSK